MWQVIDFGNGPFDKTAGYTEFESEEEACNFASKMNNLHPRKDRSRFAIQYSEG